MLKTVIASLLGAVLVVLAGLFFLGAEKRAGAPSLPLVWNADSVRSELGASSITGQEITLTLDASGRGVLVWPLPAAQAEQYPFLHLQFSKLPTAGALGISWKTPALGQNVAQHWIKGGTARSDWFQMGGRAYWTGTLLELVFLLQGEPGETVTMNSASLHPASLHAEWMTFLSDWLAFRSWSGISINTFTGVRAGSPRFYPVLVVAAVLLISLLLYGIFLLISGRSRHVDWRVPAAAFVICWLALDLVWQGKLLRQLQLTHQQFAGKNSTEKLLVGPDAALVRFMSDVRERVAAPDARLFVGSANEYLGMRANYYLYPLNAYWQRSGGELPDRDYLTSGDYIVMVKPSELRFDPESGVLHTPEGQQIPVESLGSGGLGSLFRVL